MIFQVSDASGVGEARRAAVERSKKLGFEENDLGRVAIVVTEIGTNIVKHAKSGMIILNEIPQIGSGIEILAVDSGPGHPNVERCLTDGYSTAGTAGNGLGAIKRVSDFFDIYSLVGKGTIVLGQIWPKDRSPKARQQCPQFGAISDPFPGEIECGDGWIYFVDGNRVLVLLADGLGHGPLAHTAATEAMRLFRENAKQHGVDIIDLIHAGIRHTRGCAVSVAELNRNTETINFCGIGNVSGCVFDATLVKRNMISMNGTAGHMMRKAKDFVYPYLSGSILVMHSDGIDTRWDLSAFPGIERRHPSIIAAALFRGHRRSKDDATVVVMKIAQGD